MSTALALACLPVVPAFAYTPPGPCSGAPGSPTQPDGSFNQTSAGGTGCKGRGADVSHQNGQSGGTGGNAPDIPLTVSAGQYSGGTMVRLTATGGMGGEGSTEYGAPDKSDYGGGDGGGGGGGGTISLTLPSGTTFTGDGMSAPIMIQGNGGTGGVSGRGNNEGVGGTGGLGSTVNVNLMGAIQQAGPLSITATGGAGGAGGSYDTDYIIKPDAADAGAGGAGGAITLNLQSGGATTGATLVSAGGAGGTGGKAGTHGSDFGNGGIGGAGGSGGTVQLTIYPNTTTAGPVTAGSVGGAGGTGGDADTDDHAGNGGTGGSGGSVTVSLQNGGTLTASGTSGITAYSTGGLGGDGGNASHKAGSAGAGGSAGPVTVNIAGMLTTSGDSSDGIFAQSLAGAGGNGGSAHGLIYAKGGAGNAGGTAGPVTVNGQGGSIATNGYLSNGILAQSIGGGGGKGGDASAASVGTAVAIGGNGGLGGAGATVLINNSNATAITTRGDNSAGILAQSIGGAGGAGGTVNGVGLNLFTLTIGGDGAAGATGGGVTVVNTGLITTFGALSHGIVAQSIGGGGGAGGGAISGALSAGLTVSVAVGGAGGQGSNGGDIGTGTNGINGWTPAAAGVVNSSQIITSGPDSFGIKAQSVGGGGGEGGSAVAKAYAVGGDDLPAISMSASLGGSGGSGGNGGTVYAQNQGLILTSGDGSIGFFAQSVGGGGGNGGDSSALARSYGADTPSIGVSVSLGGKGGSGGAGGNTASGAPLGVNIGNTGFILTTGQSAHGILAQSVGGGGGTGGTGDARASAAGGDGVSVSVSLGGSGGSGNLGGAVLADNAGGIVTLGDGARAIFAQSVGGGGGAGGGAGATANAGTLNLSAKVGGTGGSGNAGGPVTVLNFGALATFGADSGAILAQSIGGGGGAGGKGASSLGGNTTSGSGGNGSLATGLSSGLNNGVTQTNGQYGDGQLGSLRTLPAVVNAARSIVNLGASGSGETSTDALTDLSMAGGDADDGSTVTKVSASVAIGGSGGAGGDGGPVTVTNNPGADIGTVGNLSEAIFAQSIGGGGGHGGAASASHGPSGGVSFGVGGGGNGGAGGDGGPVSVTNSGNVTTVGSLSDAIVAQSIGGGGGRGGIAGSQTGLLQGLGVSIGGNGGANGSGNTVNVMNGGTITTTGQRASGIIAQSIGGGGGLLKSLSTDKPTNQGGGGASFDQFNIGLTFGGATGASGDGGAVSVQSTGSITTAGRDAYGIVAQSIGGGGGLVANGQLTGNQFFGSGALAGSGGSAGVMVDVYGNVTTSGQGAIGIVAQNIGGGGGLAGDTGWTEQLVPFSAADQATPHNGNGGPVTVTVESTATVQTSATNTPAILAQSIGGGGGRVSSTQGAFDGSLNGTGSGGAVNITVNGTVSALGAASPAIVAESVGNGGGGTPGPVVNVTVAQGATVSGGAAFGGDGTVSAGIYVIGGGNTQATANTINNQGTITALGGTAIYATGGYTVLTGSGMTSGSVVLDGGGGVGAVRLGAGGVIKNAASIRLGGGLFTNAGTLDVRSGGNGTTTLVGDYHAVAGGVLHVGADFARGNADRLIVVGNATLDRGSKVRVDVASWARGSVPVLTATGQLAQDPPTAEAANAVPLFGLQLAQAGNTLQVQTTSNLRSAAAGLTGNQQAVASSLEQAWNAGGSAAATAALATVGGTQGYRVALSSLAGASAGGVAAAKQAASERFTDNLIECERHQGGTTPLQERSCVWVRTGGTFTNLASDGDAAGYRQSAMTTQLGGQKEVAPGWFVGVSTGYETSWLRGDDDGTKVSGESALFGLMVKRQSGPWLLSGVVDGGYGWYRSNRQIVVGNTAGQASGSPDVAHAGLHVRAAYQLALGDWYVKPNLTASAIYRGMSGYEEHGSTPFNLAVKSSSDVVGSVSPMVEIGRGGALPGGAGTLRGFVGVGAAFSINNDWQSRAQFLEAPAGVDPFTATTRLPGAVGKLEAGLDLFTARGVEAKLSYGAQVAPGYSAQSVIGRLAWTF